MKVTHDYFKNYNTRRIDFKQSTGLFMLNGDAVPRAVLEQPSNSRGSSLALGGSSQLVFSPGKGNISPLHRHLREHAQANICSSGRSHAGSATASPVMSRVSTANTHRSHQTNRSTSAMISLPSMVLSEAELLEARRTGTPLYEALASHRVHTPKEYTNRLKTPKLEVLVDHDRLVHTAQAEFHTHIYHDNNYARIHNEQRNIHTAERLWNSREKNIKDLSGSWTAEVATPTPNNKKQLGLTPLRRIGGGQDKEHHIPKSHNTMRLHTKLGSPVSGRGNVWSLDDGKDR
jgi:hypothetical protein